MTSPIPDPVVIVAQTHHDDACVPNHRSDYLWPAEHMREHRKTASKAVAALRRAGWLLPGETGAGQVSADFLADRS